MSQRRFELECRIYSQYLTGQAPDEYVIRKYAECHAKCGRLAESADAFDRLLLVTIQDRGPGFNLAGVADPCLPENMAKGSGRGIFYMRRFADRVSFGFPRSGGVVVRIGKRLPGSP